jgi:hypothetical protein
MGYLAFLQPAQLAARVIATWGLTMYQQPVLPAQQTLAQYLALQAKLQQQNSVKTMLGVK